MLTFASRFKYLIIKGNMVVNDVFAEKEMCMMLE